jgi:copper chaperone CopZ
MKKINKLSLVIASLVFMFSLNSNGQIIKAEIRATGLTCSMCSNAINKQLKVMPEVTAVETDLNTNTFTVTLQDNNELTPKIFKEKVEKAGFSIGLLQLTASSSTSIKSEYIAVNKKQNDTKEEKFQVLDKGYVTEREFKKLSKSYKDLITYVVANENDFHIKFLN